MNLSHRIQAKTDNGDTVVDFLIEVMQDERDGFQDLSQARCRQAPHQVRLQLCKVRRGGTQTRPSTSSSTIRLNPHDAGQAPARQTNRSLTPLSQRLSGSPPTTDASVCRFLINVMEGDLKTFGPSHRMAAARELLDRGFGKGARAEVAARTPRPASTPSAPARDQAPPLVIPAKERHPVP